MRVLILSGVFLLCPFVVVRVYLLDVKCNKKNRNMIGGTSKMIKEKNNGVYTTIHIDRQTQ